MADVEQQGSAGGVGQAAEQMTAARAHMQDLLQQLLEQDEKLNGGATPDEIAAARMKLHQDIHDMRRRRAFAKAKAVQPALKTRWAPEDAAVVLAEMRKPITAEEQAPGGLDQLAMTIKECEAGGNPTDLFFALLRFYRKAWGENRWGDIRAEVKALKED